MPSREEFVAHNRDEEGVCDLLGADGLIYQTVEDMLQAGRGMNPQIERFDASCFDGDYVSGDVDDVYLESLGGAGERPPGRALPQAPGERAPARPRGDWSPAPRGLYGASARPRLFDSIPSTLSNTFIVLV